MLVVLYSYRHKHGSQRRLLIRSKPYLFERETHDGKQVRSSMSLRTNGFDKRSKGCQNTPTGAKRYV